MFDVLFERHVLLAGLVPNFRGCVTLLSPACSNRLLATPYALQTLFGSITVVAVTVHFVAAQASPTLVALVLLSGALAQVFADPLLAPLFDRYSRKQLAIDAALADIYCAGGHDRSTSTAGLHARSGAEWGHRLGPHSRCVCPRRTPT